jgi:hypothetical protein
MLITLKIGKKTLMGDILKILGQAPLSFSCRPFILNMSLRNTNGFKIETVYDYYIFMKFMFLIVNYPLTLLLAMQPSPFSYHELHTNNTKIIQNQKPFENQNFNFLKLCIHIITFYKSRSSQNHKHFLKY